MTRLDPVTTDSMNDAQRELWSSLEATRGGSIGLVGPDGGLVGPFNAMVTSPGVGPRVADLGEAIRFKSQLPEHQLEIVIVTVGAHWRSNFEFWAHARLAVRAGVDADAVAAIRDGRIPVFGDEGDHAIYTLAHELVTTGRVSTSTYETAGRHLSDAQLVDAVFTAGYYSLVSMTLNAFEVPLPEGVDPIFPE